LGDTTTLTTKYITSVDEIQAVDNTDKVFVNDNGSFKQISVSNLMKQAPSGVTEETDPTVSEWAKNPTKPTYTATEVGADASGTADTKVSEHNVSEEAHNDIRLLVQGLTDRLNTLADSDDDTLDQMSEIVAYIKSNKTLIDAITTQKVSVADIVDNLTTNVSNKPLSAAQGVALKALIDGIVIPETLPNPQKLIFSGAVTGEYDGSAELNVNIPESSGGGTTNYNNLSNKPQLNGVTLEGNKTLDQVGVLAKNQGSSNSGKYLSVGSDGNVVLAGAPSGLSEEAIDKLEEVGNYLVYTTADGGSKWEELIDILRQGSSGGETEQPESGIVQTGSILAISSGVTATQTGSVLKITQEG